MIPKVIHYCWFGGKPLTKLAKKCIKSWKKYCPDYEIKEWNESNYDVNACPYVQEAYKAKKYPFVSDYARFDILYKYGGLYFDTDVEILKPIDQIVSQGAFMGVENINLNQGEEKIAVAPGLGIAAQPQMPVYKELIDFYNSIHFVNNSNLLTIVDYTTNILKEHGLQIKDENQKVCDLTIYQKEYFNPTNMHTREVVLTDKTVSIHHYAGSWLGKKEKFKRFVRKIVGNKIYLFFYDIKHKKKKKA